MASVIATFAKFAQRQPFVIVLHGACAGRVQKQQLVRARSCPERESVSYPLRRAACGALPVDCKRGGKQSSAPSLPWLHQARRPGTIHNLQHRRHEARQRQSARLSTEWHQAKARVRTHAASPKLQCAELALLQSCLRRSSLVAALA